MRSRRDWAQLAADLAPDRPLIAANLPYNVATLLLIGWLESEPWPPWYRRMVLMFQKEVAERIAAKPATKAYGRLAVIAQWRMSRSPAVHDQPGGLHPAAHGRLRARRIQPIERPLPACSVKMLGRVTGAAFGQRRKMLRQSLKPLVARYPRPCSPPPASIRPCAARRSALPTSPGSPTCSSAGRGGFGQLAQSSELAQHRDEGLKPDLPRALQALRRQDRPQARRGLPPDRH